MDLPNGLTVGGPAYRARQTNDSWWVDAGVVFHLPGHVTGVVFVYPGGVIQTEPVNVVAFDRGSRLARWFPTRQEAIADAEQNLRGRHAAELALLAGAGSPGGGQG